MRFDRTTRRVALALAAGLLTASALPAVAQDGPKKIRIGVIGAGNIGGTIGTLWVKDGHEVMFASRHPETLAPMIAELGPKAKAGTPEEAVKFGDAVFVAVPYKAYPELSKDLGASLTGKVVLDAGNATQKRTARSMTRFRRTGSGRPRPSISRVRSWSGRSTRPTTRSSPRRAPTAARIGRAAVWRSRSRATMPRP